MSHLLEGLNEVQREAVLNTEGPLLIVAGAGAGKTKTITHRIARLIEMGVPANQILGITFTNKAGREMRERLENLLPKDFGGARPVLKTFHALGVMIIREEYHSLNLPKNAPILDENETLSLVREAIIAENLDPKQFEPKRFRNAISKEKGELTDVLEYAARAEDYFPELLARIWLLYEKALAEKRALDFDDLLVKPVRLFQTNTEIRARWQNRFRYILVDEYQDTNTTQYQLTKYLVGENKNICVVGDSDQNIYSWRGANLRNILNFETDYPEAKVILLEENYRSTPIILSAANAVIQKNTVRKNKNLFTKALGGDLISLYAADNENEEAVYVASKIKEAIRGGVPPRKIAVLYRANFQSRVLEAALIEQKIEHEVAGVRFFMRKEVKDVLAVLGASLNNEPIYLSRALLVVGEGLGKVSLLKILAGEENSLTPKQKGHLNVFREILKDVREYSFKNLPSETVAFAARRSGIFDSLAGKSEEMIDRRENLAELVALAKNYDSLGESGLQTLLDEAALLGEADGQNGEKVRLMTVHAAKGLEFEIVFITGLEEDLFPHAKPTHEYISKEDAEEERRLFYVALTRAEKKLYLSYAQSRMVFGSRRIGLPSQFLADIPEQLWHEEENKIETPWTGKTVYLDLD